MPALLLYLLKANVALVLFYLAYHLVLRKLTFYHLNRLFLAFGIVFSAAYPLVDLSELFSRHQEFAAIHTYAVVLPAWSPAAIPEQEAAFDYWLIPVAFFWIGCTVMLIRLLVQFASLYQLHCASVPDTYQGVNFRKVAGISEAFSFWRTIYLNPARHQSPELESILRHEQIHVHGWHTLDVLLAELSTVFYWFNPGVWLMKGALKENLEFIADQHVVDAGVDRKEYQYLLLKVVGATQPQIANQFNFPSLKRRIAMMNKMPTNKANRLRLLVVLPLVTVLLVAFQSSSQTDIADIPTPAQQQDSALYYIDGIKSSEEEARKLSPDAIHEMVVYKQEHAKEAPGNVQGLDVISLISKENKDAEQVRKFRKIMDGFANKLPQIGAKQNLPVAGLYFIDGVEASREDAEKLDPKEIHSVNVYKDASAVKAFGNKAAKGVISIITEQNKDSRQVQEFYQKLPPPPAPPKPGTPPPPPPPTRYEGPAIPKAGGARLVETEEYVSYFLWPEEIPQRELETAQQAFKENGFDLTFEEKHAGGKTNSLKIALASKNKKSRATATYDARALESILAADNIMIVQGNKKTGAVMIATTLAPR